MCIYPIDWESTTKGITRLWQYLPPAHYTLRVESFSLFLSNNIDNYESCAFESGGFKWKLSLYPNGNKKMNVKDHISLYLALANTEDLSSVWEVNVTFKFFLYNHIRDKYLTFQDAKKSTRRLFTMKTEVGFNELFPLSILNDPSNGFLVNDGCIFGAEIFVTKLDGRRECISMIKDPKNNSFIWEIPNFSQIAEKYRYSDEFVVGDHKWKLLLYPKGDTNVAKGESISLYLVLVDDLPSDRKVLAEYVLRVGDNHISKSKQRGGIYWFCGSMEGWGYPNLLSIHDQSASYLVNGTLTVEAQITLVSKHKDF